MRSDLQLALLNLHEVCLLIRESQSVYWPWKKNFVMPWDKFYEAIERVERLRRVEESTERER